MRTVVPRPGSLSIASVPPDSRTTAYTCDRPSPVPWPVGLVVKNGSIARARTSSVMPDPVSVTASSTCGRPRSAISDERRL